LGAPDDGTKARRLVKELFDLIEIALLNTVTNQTDLMLYYKFRNLAESTDNRTMQEMVKFLSLCDDLMHEMVHNTPSLVNRDLAVEHASKVAAEEWGWDDLTIKRAMKYVMEDVEHKLTREGIRMTENTFEKFYNSYIEFCDHSGADTPENAVEIGLDMAGKMAKEDWGWDDATITAAKKYAREHTTIEYEEIGSVMLRDLSPEQRDLIAKVLVDEAVVDILRTMLTHMKPQQSDLS
jgi:hypothetical protein